MALKHKMEDNKHKKILVKDLNSVITCRLCEGYFIDATTLVECLHTFCRGCILRHFENSKTVCPMCNTAYKKKSQSCFRSDSQIQTLVYKLVPSLFLKESQRREDFYRSTGVRAGSSCSDDSVIERERDMINDTEESISSQIGDKNQFYSPDELISLSLEYYQSHLDTTDTKRSEDKIDSELKTNTSDANDNNSDGLKTDSDQLKNNSNSDKNVGSSDGTGSNNMSTEHREKNKEQHSENGDGNNYCESVADNDNKKTNKDCDKRFLRCPAAVSMKHLQKFVRMKYGLTADHKVDIIYKGEVLRNDFSLMDVAYTFGWRWKEKKPMRFFYRIYTPMKIRPIKIVNTTLSSGGKQLQIVPVKSSSDTPEVENKPEEKPAEEKPNRTTLTEEETEDQKQDKERLFAHLQLQSTSKAQSTSVENKKIVPEKLIKDCVFEYEEPDQEEIKRFAEKRDREWALQKKLEEEARLEEEYVSHHFTKKRKKSKHSKSEFNPHKKRKLHAEITSNEKEDLKLKVKITTNGHKHKHHKSTDSSDKSEISSKEKLLQMRQVRLKHHSSGSGDEKSSAPSTPSLPSHKSPKEIEREDDTHKKEESSKLTYFVNRENGEEKKKRESPKTVENSNKYSPSEIAKTPEITKVDENSPKPNSIKIVRQDATKKEWGVKLPTVRIERNEQTEKQAQKTFLTTFKTYAEKYHKIEKINQSKMENNKTLAIKPTHITSISTNNKNLDRKIASLQQRCTVEAKNPAPVTPKVEKIEKKVTFNTEKPKIITPQYPPGFTVSKIESGIKRKAEDCNKIQDKRPSLEITLINPNPVTTTLQATKPTEAKSIAKRPPPATIPLERIKKAVNTKSGISIIPKMPERCDIGPLDLSRKSPDNSPPKASHNNNTPELVNGFNKKINNFLPRPNSSPGRGTPDKSNVQLSNLQMLSKVATEHSSLNQLTANPSNNVNSKVRPQLPNLQTLKISSGGVKPTATLQRMPPKLNEIQKFRPVNPQIRNMRPNQNQNIRNIPNPSLLINRQQNQNRLSNPSSMDKRESCASPKPHQSTSMVTQVTSKEVTSMKSAIALEQKVSEMKEISV